MLKIYRCIIAKILILVMIFQCIMLQLAFAAKNGDEFIPLNSELNMGDIMFNDENSDESYSYADFDGEEEKMKVAEQKLTEEDEILQNLFSAQLINESDYSRSSEKTDKDGKEVFKDGKSIYASGIPILIKKENDKVYIFDKSGSNKLLEAPIDESITIFGGGKDVSVDSTEIIMQEGIVSSIIGGGRNGSVLKDTKITLNGGTINLLVCGGGRESNANVKNTYITVTNKVNAKWIYGGGYFGSVLQDTNVNLTDSQFSYVCGGGYQGDVIGNTKLKIKDCNISDTVFGGGWRGKVNGNTNMTFENSTSQYVCGGGYLTNKEENSDSTVGQDTEINILNSNVTEKVYGGGWTGDVIGSSNVTLSGGTVANLYGGGYESLVKNSANVIMNNGIVTATLFGGGQKESAEVKNIFCTLSGGTIGFLYGGGWKAKTNGNVNISLSGVIIQNIAFGGGYFESAEVNNTDISVTNGSSAEALYGGGENARVLENSAIFIEGGKIKNVYGGGRNNGADVNSTNVIINGGNVSTVFGGGDKSNVLKKSSLSISSTGEINFVSGGGYRGSSNEIDIKLSNGEIKTLYGGGYESDAKNVNINILNGDIYQLILGSGTNGISQKSEAHIYGGIVRDLYSGYHNEINVYYSGGSILLNRTGIVADEQNNPLYKTEIFVNDKPIVNKIVKCKFNNSIEWYSKTDDYGKLVVYLPLNKVNITVKDENSSKTYDGSITVSANGTNSVTILEKSNQEEYTVTFCTRTEKGIVSVKADDLDINSGSKVKKGSKVVFKAVPKDNFYIKDWVCNGEAINSNDSTYVIENISQSTRIEVIFEKNVVDFKELKSTITSSQSIKSEVVVSIEGNDVETNKKWVTRNVMKQFQSEISLAKSVLNAVDCSQKEVDDAQYRLEKAKQLFESKIQFGNGIKDIVDRSALNKLITTAEDTKSEISVSDDGLDIEKTQKWVTKIVMENFLMTIEEAENVADKKSITQPEIEDTVEKLENEIETFISSQKYGQKVLKIKVEYYSKGKGTIKASVNGNIIESPYMALPEDILLFSALPKDGYKIDYWTQNCNIINSEQNSFELKQIQESVTICVYFSKDDIEEQEKYFVNLSNDIKNGLISVSENGSIKPGTIIYLNVFPEEGYYLSDNSLKYNGIIVENDSFIMPNENVLITAEFLPINNNYTLIVTSEIGGTVTGGGIFKEGEKTNIKAFANSGYKFDKWESQYKNYIDDINNYETNVIMPSNDMSVKALFKPISSSGGSSDDSSSNDNSYNNTAVTPKNSVVKTVPFVNIKLESNENVLIAVLNVNAKPDSDGNCILQISNKDILDALALLKKKTESVQEISLKVSLNLDKSAENITLNSIHFILPENIADFYNENNQGKLYLNTPIASLHFDERALKSILSQYQGSIQFSVSKIADLSVEASKMIGDRPVFEFIILSNQRQITTFGGGQATISIPYELKGQEKGEDVIACYIDKNKNASIWKASMYDSKNKILSINTTHFSGFGVTLLSNNAEQQIQESDKKYFKDIKGHWAENDIIEMTKKGIINGMTETEFMPNDFMTRGMLITIVGRAGNVSVNDYLSCSFEDVEDNSYYMPYIAWASENNIANGTSKNKFSPNKPLTREEMAVILYQYILYLNKDVPEIKQAVIFEDDSMISSWAKEAIYALQKADLLYGKKDNILEPDSKATRAEVISLISRVLETLT